MVRERYYTQVTVLEDRRPYDVQVQVFLEGRNQEGGFAILLTETTMKAAVIAEAASHASPKSRQS